MKATEMKKEAMLVALEQRLGMVTHACKDVGISRNCHYDWMKHDEDYRKKVEDIDEGVIDFVESKLLKSIDEGSEKSIIFYMKYKGKKRGYTNAVDITTAGAPINEIKLIRVDKPDDI